MVGCGAKNKQTIYDSRFGDYKLVTQVFESVSLPCVEDGGGREHT